MIGRRPKARARIGRLMDQSGEEARAPLQSVDRRFEERGTYETARNESRRSSVSKRSRVYSSAYSPKLSRREPLYRREQKLVPLPATS